MALAPTRVHLTTGLHTPIEIMLRLYARTSLPGSTLLSMERLAFPSPPPGSCALRLLRLGQEQRLFFDDRV